MTYEDLKQLEGKIIQSIDRIDSDEGDCGVEIIAGSEGTKLVVGYSGGYGAVSLDDDFIED